VTDRKDVIITRDLLIDLQDFLHRIHFEGSFLGPVTFPCAYPTSSRRFPFDQHCITLKLDLVADDTTVGDYFRLDPSKKRGYFDPDLVALILHHVKSAISHDDNEWRSGKPEREPCGNCVEPRSRKLPFKTCHTVLHRAGRVDFRLLYGCCTNCYYQGNFETCSMNGKSSIVFQLPPSSLLSPFLLTGFFHIVPMDRGNDDLALDPLDILTDLDAPRATRTSLNVALRPALKLAECDSVVWCALGSLDMEKDSRRGAIKDRTFKPGSKMLPEDLLRYWIDAQGEDSDVEMSEAEDLSDLAPEDAPGVEALFDDDTLQSIPDDAQKSSALGFLSSPVVTDSEYESVYYSATGELEDEPDSADSAEPTPLAGRFETPDNLSQLDLSLVPSSSHIPAEIDEQMLG
jgi:hypothetical protein